MTPSRRKPASFVARASRSGRTRNGPRPVDVGANVIVGYVRGKIDAAIDYFKTTTLDYENPLGNGDTSERIFKILHDA